MEVDNQIKDIITNLNDKLRLITIECMGKVAYPEYIDEKLKSIEWDIRVLRNRVDMAISEKEDNHGK